MIDEIRFYRASEKPYGAFSNLYRRPIEFEGEVFATSEHAYQAGKARKPEVRKWLLAAPSPALLAMAAHGLYYWDIAPGWSKTKFDRMREVLRAKFTQHSDLQDLLLSTGEARLVESATVDNEVNRLWGQRLRQEHAWHIADGDPRGSAVRIRGLLGGGRVAVRAFPQHFASVGRPALLKQAASAGKGTVLGCKSLPC